MPRKSNTRQHERVQVGSRVVVGWAGPGGGPSVTQGRCVDISETGIGLQVSDPVPMRTYVSFRVPDSKFVGSGSVRHCERTGKGYVLGIEFSGGLRWREQAPTAKA